MKHFYIIESFNFAKTIVNEPNADVAKNINPAKFNQPLLINFERAKPLEDQTTAAGRPQKCCSMPLQGCMASLFSMISSFAAFVRAGIALFACLNLGVVNIVRTEFEKDLTPCYNISESMSKIFHLCPFNS